MELRGSLPFLRTLDEATALCEKEQDNFYISAFMIECWLGNVTLRVHEEYAGKKKAKHRKMQTGQTWHGFMEVFGHAKDTELHHVYTSLLRFAEYDDVQSELLRRAIVPLSYEHLCFKDYIGPNSLEVAKRPAEAVAMLRRTMERWCDWVDALVHFRAHGSWHLAPLEFDPDPEKRELAALGINQRFFGAMNNFSRKWWEWHHGEAAARFKDSPKWQVVGKAMSAHTERVWNYPQLDEVVIWLWPLLKRNNWTYRDMMNVTRKIVTRPNSYPCQRDQDFAAYCTNVLGLKKPPGPPGKSSPDGKPPGYEVALRLCERKSNSASS